MKTKNINIRLEPAAAKSFEEALDLINSDPDKLVSKSSAIRNAIKDFTKRVKKKYNK